jgi:hypothetical protein
MGTRVSFKFGQLLEERRLTRIKPDRKLILKEIEGAKSDLETARKSLQDGNFKWSIIQGYYSIFHAARALVYSKGFREKSHYALLVAIQELFHDEFESFLIQGFGDRATLSKTLKCIDRPTSPGGKYGRIQRLFWNHSIDTLPHLLFAVCNTDSLILQNNF